MTDTMSILHGVPGAYKHWFISHLLFFSLTVWGIFRVKIKSFLILCCNRSKCVTIRRGLTLYPRGRATQLLLKKKRCSCGKLVATLYLTWLARNLNFQDKRVTARPNYYVSNQIRIHKCVPNKSTFDISSSSTESNLTLTFSPAIAASVSTSSERMPNTATIMHDVIVRIHNSKSTIQRCFYL